MNRAFHYFLPVNLYFGRGQIDRVGDITKDYGTHALLVTGRTSARKSGLTDRILQHMQESDLKVTLFEEVTSNPLTTTVLEGCRRARENGCDVIIAAGGGSIIDCAKGIAFMMKNDGDLDDYIFGRASGTEAMPLIAVPTTCGTGSEGNHFAILTNPETGDKKGMVSDAVIPKASIIDSSLMETMPKKILASVGFDALCHNIEAYTSVKAQPLSDMQCEYALKLIGWSLLHVYESGGTEEDWDNLALASTLGGMVIHTAGVAAPHGMEHPISGLKNVTHGLGLAPLEPIVMKRNIKACAEKYAYISRCFSGENENDCIERIINLLERLDMRIGLKDLGIQEKDIPWLTENCMKVSAGNVGNNPVKLNREDVEAIYREALEV